VGELVDLRLERLTQHLLGQQAERLLLALFYRQQAVRVPPLAGPYMMVALGQEETLICRVLDLGLREEILLRLLVQTQPVLEHYLQTVVVERLLLDLPILLRTLDKEKVVKLILEAVEVGHLRIAHHQVHQYL
jgi:hypothetical protein